MQNTCTQLIRYSCVPHTGTAHFPKQDRWQCWTRKTQSFGFRGGRYGPVLAVTQVLRWACRTLLIVHYWLLLMPTPPPLSFCWRPIYLIYLHLPVSLSGQDSVTANHDCMTRNDSSQMLSQARFALPRSKAAAPKMYDTSSSPSWYFPFTVCCCHVVHHCFPQLLLHIKAIYLLNHINFSNHIIGLHFDRG